MVLKYAYSVFIGVLLATFVGVGIAAFYESPQQPDYLAYPEAKVEVSKEATDAALMIERDKEMNRQWKEYEKVHQVYNRNVSIIALVGAIVLLALSITILSSKSIITDGVLLGSVLTLLYSIIRGFETNDNKFRFVVVSVGLFISLYLGYRKFVAEQKAKK